MLDKAKKKLKLLKLRNIDYKHDDGTLGWEEKAPFDAILTTAAPQTVPNELLRQLADGGRLVIPVGGEGQQKLKLITKKDEEFREDVLNLVRFVPLLKGQLHR